MQEKLPAAGALPRTPLGELTALPRPPSWWGGRLAAPLQLPPAVGPLDLASPVPPHQNCVPTWFRLALNLISAVRLKLVFSCT